MSTFVWFYSVFCLFTGANEDKPLVLYLEEKFRVTIQVAPFIRDRMRKVMVRTGGRKIFPAY